MSAEFPQCPNSLKPIQHFMKIAQEHDERDPVVSYWARLYALQQGLKLKTNQPDETAFLMAIMDWLETLKKSTDNEAISNEVAAQAHIDNYALKLFLYADKQDREMNYGKNVVKAFYSCGVLYDILQTFGELTEEAANNRKYAKWKAAYIHNCLKNGETPVPGPMVDEEGEGDNEAAGENPEADHESPEQPTTENISPPSAEDVLNDPDKLPSPPQEDESPSDFKPFIPEVKPELKPFTTPVPLENLKLTDEQMTKAQKYCKYAGNSLNYDDVKAAVEYLQKALNLLTTGTDE